MDFDAILSFTVPLYNALVSVVSVFYLVVSSQTSPTHSIHHLIPGNSKKPPKSVHEKTEVIDHLLKIVPCRFLGKSFFYSCRFLRKSFFICIVFGYLSLICWSQSGFGMLFLSFFGSYRFLGKSFHLLIPKWFWYVICILFRFLPVFR